MTILRYFLLLSLSSFLFANFSNAQTLHSCNLDYFKNEFTTVNFSVVEKGENPAHCRINGKINERVSKADGKTYAIGFEMRLPTEWNQRFLFQGNGGNDGRVVPALGSSANHSVSALAKGFAVISTDAGHQSESLFGGANFGRDPEARLDYGYRANEFLTPLAKNIIQSYYKKQPDYSYFMGCSNGGRHAMVAASRLVNEFDGFIAGNPGFNLPKAAIQHAWDIQQLSSINNDLSKSLTPSDLDLLSAGILKACDQLDGAQDQMIQAIAACQSVFKLEKLSCENTDDVNCIDAEKVSVIEKLFTGPINKSGEQLYSDWAYDAGVNGSDWSRWKIKSPIANLPMIATLGAGSLAEIFLTPPRETEPRPEAFVTFLKSFDFDKDAPDINTTSEKFTESAMSFMTPPQVEQLTELKNSRNKLLVYHGASDGVFSVNDTIRWYENLSDNHDQKTKDFARLFLVPGMNHCAGGPATDRFDMLAAMMDWVEKDKAPDAIPAQVNPNNKELPSVWSKERARPLCPYPQVALYKGSGDIEDSESFSCQNNN